MANKLFILITISWGIFSCSPFKILKKDFLSTKASIDYIHTTPLADRIEQSVPIYVAPPLVLTGLPEVSKVSKVKSEVIPLLIFNQWNHQYHCVLGKSEIKEEAANYLKASLIEEGKRRGYRFENQITDASFQLELTIESLSAEGPYTNTGFFAYFVFFYVSQTIEKAEPGMAESRIHFKLKNKDEVLIDETVVSSASFELLKKERISFKELHMAYRSNLAELLGNTFEQNIDKILKRVAQRL
jgi:hypothetical protein